MCNNSLCSYCGIAKEVFKNGEFEEHFQEHLGDQHHCIVHNATKQQIEHMRRMHKGQQVNVNKILKQVIIKSHTVNT